LLLRRREGAEIRSDWNLRRRDHISSRTTLAHHVSAKIFDGGWKDFYLVAETVSPPENLASAVRAAVNGQDSNLPVFDVRTIEDVMAASAAQQKFTALVIGCFALVALILAAVGMYGVLYHVVSQRTNEIGIRVVLGATSREVRRLVLWQGIGPVLVGIILGLAASAAATRYMASLSAPAILRLLPRLRRCSPESRSSRAPFPLCAPRESIPWWRTE